MAIDLVRETALKILYDINENGAYSNIAVNKYLEANEFRDIDKGFVTELVYGSLKWKITIDWIIQQFSSVKIKKISPWILNILRLGVYQLLYTDRIPESAACNESVNLSKRYGHQGSSGYVNAVLRNIVRNKNSIKYPDEKTEYKRFLSVKYSHPEWMVSSWLTRYGNAFTEELLASNNEIPEFTIRVNTLMGTKEHLVKTLQENGIEAVEGKYFKDALVIKNPASIMKQEVYKNGLFQIQDESSMLVAKILDPKPGETIMDVCSAPGGKSTHIAELMENKGTVIARDIHEHKIKIINEAAKRLGLSIISSEVFDAAKLDESYLEKADRVLVDAPCTGFGIIRRKPDIKWSRNITDKDEITKLQMEILSVASKYVKHGGVLVYSTCTIEPEENEVQIDKFLKNNNEFSLTEITSLLPDKLKKPEADKGYVQLYTNIDNIDGFFIAKMVKRG